MQAWRTTDFSDAGADCKLEVIFESAGNGTPTSLMDNVTYTETTGCTIISCPCLNIPANNFSSP
jgi:hypothetical protein